MNKSVLLIALSALLLLPVSGYSQKLSREEKKAQKEAAKQAIFAALESDTFNVILTRNVPMKNEPIVQYADGRSMLRIRGNNAETFMPGVKTTGYMEFGGGEQAGGMEPVPFSCERESKSKVEYNYVLKQKHSADYEIKVRASLNGTAYITVVRKPMYIFKFYGEVVPVEID